MYFSHDNFLGLSKPTREAMAKDLSHVCDTVLRQSQNIWDRMVAEKVSTLTGRRHRVKMFLFDDPEYEYTNALSFTSHGGNPKTDSPNLTITWGNRDGRTSLAWLSKSYSDETLPPVRKMILMRPVFDWNPEPTKEVQYPMGLYQNQNLSILAVYKWYDPVNDKWCLESPLYTFDFRDHLPRTVLDWEDESEEPVRDYL
jgi:hypothetical protein